MPDRHILLASAPDLFGSYPRMKLSSFAPYEVMAGDIW